MGIWNINIADERLYTNAPGVSYAKLTIYLHEPFLLFNDIVNSRMSCECVLTTVVLNLFQEI